MLKSIDRNSALPLHSQIKDQLLRFIDEKREQGGNKEQLKLLPEEALTRIFGVSRLTVRQAVRDLVNEGHLYRVRGVGTFITPRRISGQLDQIETFIEEWTLQSKQIEVVVAAYETKVCSEQWLSDLGLPAGTPVFYIRRIRYADGCPVALDDRYLPAEFMSLVKHADIVREPIFITLARRGKMIIEKADYQISATVASAEQASVLKIKRGSPLLARRLVIYAAPARPIMAGCSLYRSDLFTYSVSLRPGVI
ncbi:GntR family transcriptional regulator [Desulfomonile tiedjei]|uniref:Transcriptional regulator n=1 Tax=Desulfomonile tiedjei (strain ATCC 49306 / DSM 6799 / DCB-1) TaxID=706587 RepID=I4CBS0_DESTA|nr:GntR family transcriptional regulator [Desulfomonile tiedjei]AFM27011.1 transcriptional regulator [Desulfomonile tiedjei DSM 6799]